MREADLFLALSRWLTAATGIDVYEAFPNAPRPTGQYATANLIAAEQLGQSVAYRYEEAEEAGPDGIKDLFQIPVLPFEWRYSINVFAPDPVDRSRRVATWASSDAGAFKLYPLLVQPIGTIRRLPQEVDGHWEGRAQFDLFIRGYLARGVITDGAGNEIEIGRVPVDEVLEGTITLGPYTNPDLLSGDYKKP